MNVRSLLVLFLVPAFLACSTPEWFRQGMEEPKPSPRPTVTFTQPQNELHVGYLQHQSTQAQFQKVLNETYMPLYRLADPQRLGAFRIVLPLDTGSCVLPKEVALTSFPSPKAQTDFQSSEIGKKILEARSLLFHPRYSRTLTVQPFEGRVLADQAYSLRSDFKDYGSGHAVVHLHCDPPLKGKALLEKIAQAYSAPGSSARNVVFAVVQDQVIEVVFYDPARGTDPVFNEARTRFKGVFHEIARVFIRKDSIGAFPLRANKGIDHQW